MHSSSRYNVKTDGTKQVTEKSGLSREESCAKLLWAHIHTSHLANNVMNVHMLL